jgi:hypothetical protein
MADNGLPAEVSGGIEPVTGMLDGEMQLVSVVDARS